MAKQIAPSMMCADILNMGAQLKAMEENGIEYLHIDIMDGVYVPNFTLGTDYTKKLKNATKIPLDIHMMVMNPEDKLDWFAFGEGDYVSVHAESTHHLQRALQKIKARGAKAMVALNPGTPISVLDYVLDDISAVLVMTVNPGFAGQKLVPQTLKKITDLKKYLKEHGREDVEIEVDGNVNFPNARLMSDAGADIFVAGTSSIFTDVRPMAESIAMLREAIK